MTSLLWACVTALVLYFQTCNSEPLIGEGYFLVDNMAIKPYIARVTGQLNEASKRAQAIAQMKIDIQYILTEANKLLTSLGTLGINFQIQILDTVFMNEDIFSAGANLQVDTNTVLNLLSQYAIKEKIYTTRKYDFILLFTGYDLIDAGGIARQGAICNSISAVSVVEMKASYFTAISVAHEVGHLLGAGHDLPGTLNLMVAHSQPLDTQRWSFGLLSFTQITATLAGLLLSNCLLKKNAESTIPSMTWDKYTGDMLDPTKLCQVWVNDSRSGLCLDLSLYNNVGATGDPVCQAMYCRIPETADCTAAFTSEGMICNRGGRCSKGKCISDSSTAAANVDPTCVFGNVPQVNVNNALSTCEIAVTANTKSICYLSSLQQQCCSTCKKFKTSIPGCEYGDKAPNCNVYKKSLICPSRNRAMCCEYCNGYIAKRSAYDGSHTNITLVPQFDPGCCRGQDHPVHDKL